MTEAQWLLLGAGAILLLAFAWRPLLSVAMLAFGVWRLITWARGKWGDQPAGPIILERRKSPRRYDQ